MLERPGWSNRGTGPSRSLGPGLGLYHARGRHLAFLDAADDIGILSTRIALWQRKP